MNILVLVVEFYIIITVMAIITSVARFLATPEKEREARKQLLKKMLEQAEKSGSLSKDKSIVARFINLKVTGIKEDNKLKVFVFNAVMHFVPLFNIGIVVGNASDVIKTFSR